MLFGLLVSTAHAQAAAAPSQPGPVEMFMPFIFIFVIFYFLIIRPQSKRAKAHQSFVSGLKRGDKVVTASGILGTVEGITDHVVTLEIADGVSIKILRSQVSGSQKDATEEKK